MESEDKPTRPAPPPVYYDHFEICRRADGALCELGRGGMGITYKAYNRQFKDDVLVALKIIRPREAFSSDPTAPVDPEWNTFILNSFLREGEAAALIDHPNVARAQQRGRTEAGDVYLVMDFVEGESLQRFLNQQHPRQLPVPVALALARQTARALRAIHDKNILHRDLKPSNIMLKRDVEADDHAEEVRQAGGCLVKVIDFGLAKGMAGSHLDAVTNFIPTRGPGTAHYASPEQLAGSTDLRPSADIYSLGAVLWEMVAGQPPLSHISEHTLRQDPCVDRPLPPETLMRLPAPLAGLLKRMLAYLPEGRPQTARELLEEIEACRQALAPAAPPVSRAGKAAAASADAVPAVGETVADRYRIDVWCARGDGGDLFRATDLRTQQPVALKWLARSPSPEGPARLAGLPAEWRKLAANPHPNLLVHAADGLHLDPARGNAPMYFVREWAAGISLSDLLPLWNALSAEELFRLLPELPGVLDHAAQHDLHMAEIALRKVVLVHSQTNGKDAAGSEWTREDWGKLRARPLEQWPALSLKYNALGFPALTADSADQGNPLPDAPTRMPEAPLLSTAGAVRNLALLIRELLGAPAGLESAVPALGGEIVNGVLRRALSGQAEADGAAYGSCQEFWDALSKAHAAEHLQPWAGAGKEVIANSRHNTRPKAPIPSPGRGEHTRRKLSLPVAAAIAAAVVAIGLFTFVHPRSANTPPVPGVTNQIGGGAGEKPKPGDQPAARTGLVTADLTKAYTNTLGMKFVPVQVARGGSVLMSKYETRFSDYQCLLIRNKSGVSDEVVWTMLNGQWQQTKGDWLHVNSAQTTNDPVVAVSLAEARQFCETLTNEELAAGRIAPGLRYRLPNQAEWDAAVNAGSATAVRYFWGVDWPPPSGSGNYAGTEVKAEWPGNYQFIENYQDGFPRTAPVGSFPANALGLYDLDGNVSEWCDYPKDDSRQEFATRGGSWLSGDKITLSRNYVSWRAADYRATNVGFRCVLAPE